MKSKNILNRFNIFTLMACVLMCWGLMTIPSEATAFSLNPGDVLVSNHGGLNVQRLDPGTGTITTLTSIPTTPIGLAFDPSGNLYINADSGIYRLDKTTDVLTTFFTGVGQREGLAYDPILNHLFSVSYGANTIEEVNLSGGLVRTISIPGTGNVLGVATRGDNLMVTDYTSGKVLLGTTTGSTFDLVGTLTPGNTYAVDMDAAGNIYANDFALGKTEKFSLVGGVWTPSDFITGLTEPANGLSIGDDGSLTISEYGANAISIWNSDGSLRNRYSGVQNPDELVVYAPVRQHVGVPEPTTLLLLGTGLVGMFGWRRHKGKQKIS